jgi:hypothetical protein
LVYSLGIKDQIDTLSSLLGHLTQFSAIPSFTPVEFGEIYQLYADLEAPSKYPGNNIKFVFDVADGPVNRT